MFHAVDGAKLSSQLSNGMLVQSLVQNAEIRINVYTAGGQTVRWYTYTYART